MADSGPRFGRYRLQGRIAAGGMGEVFKATARAFDGVEKVVAVKLIKTGLAQDPDLIKMFVEEAKVAFLLNHANLVQTFDVGTVDGQYFLAMEYVDGLTLANVLKGCRDVLGQPMPQRHAVFIAVETLKGLHHAHKFRDGSGMALGIVHRDVSPSNILISREGEVKVSDFGIAWSTMKSSKSELGTIKGKVQYMPPEQVHGAALDARADVYAVGVVLYETLCGRAPFLGPIGTIIPLVVEGRFTPPRDLNPDLPERLEQVVLRAMAGDPEARYPSAAAMRDELEEFAMGQAWRLSSMALASFVEALEVPRARESPEALAFDALLGEELRKVGEGDALSVFTSAGPARAQPPLAAPPPSPHAPVAPSPMAAVARTEAESSYERSPPTHSSVSAVTRPPTRRGLVIGLYTAALLGVGLAAALAARSSAPEVPTGAPVLAQPVATVGPSPRPAAPGTAPASSPRVEAAPPTSSDAAMPLGEEPPAAARPEAPAAPAITMIAINTEPWTYVDIDGARLGPTPQRQRIRPGRHRITLSNPGRGLSRTLSVSLREGEYRRIVLDLTR